MHLREDIRHGAWTLLSAIFLIASTFITAAEAREYTVQPGDFLGKIAQAHGCRVGQLLSVNPQIKNPDRVAAGMKLNVDCSNAPMAVLERRKPGSRKAKSIRMRLDTKTLEKKMRKRGFKPPSKFRGLIIEIGLKNGRVHTERAFDWKGLSKEPRGWNAASSIKFFAAIAALEQITKWGFKPSAWVEFHHLKTGKKTKCMIRQKNCTVKELVDAALIQSDNIAYNRLVQLAGYDYLNGNVLSKKRGITGTGLHSPYAKSKWRPLSGVYSFRNQPKIVIRQGRKKKVIKARTFKRGKKGQYHCPWGGTCSSLYDLAEGVRRLMLHEQLPRSEQYRVDRGYASAEGPNMALIRKSMGIYDRPEQRRRGMEFVKGLRKAFKDPDVRMFHKPGYAGKWFSDIVYVYLPRSKRRWIVAAAGYPGRGTLTQAGRIMGQIIKDPNAFRP